MRSRHRIAAPLLLAGGLASCTLGPDYERPLMPAPETYRDRGAEAASIADLDWWELFRDRTLQALILEGLANNRDLGASLARIDQARANLVVLRSELYPELGYAGGGSALTTTEGGGVRTSGSLAAGAFWQVDLWGRIRRGVEAGEQEVLASEEALRGVTITLVADIAGSYLLLRDLDNRVLVTERTIETRRRSLELIETRFAAGAVSEVDVNQAEILLETASASLQVFERLRVQTENGISLLLGVPPMEIPRGVPLQEQVFPPEVPAGLPADLLGRRPDVLASERRLAAQTARIGVAEALRYPQLNLSADLGAQFVDGGADLGFLDAGFDLFGPLFNWGRNQAFVDLEKARTEELLFTYQQVFLNSLREVENAITAVRTYSAELDARLRQLAAANSASELTWVRYENGSTSYLEVLEVERSRFAAELAASEALQLRLTSIVELYLALGGGWSIATDEEPVDAEPPAGP